MGGEIGGLTLSALTAIHVTERATFVRHRVPGMDGDLSQAVGRTSVEIELSGIFYGADAADRVKQLRDLYLNREPVDFFTAATGEGYFAQVLISALEVDERAGELDQFSYCCRVHEYIEPPEPVIPAGGLPSLDTGLLGEAAGFIDDVQNAVDQVSQIADLLTNVPSFADPTSRLGELPSAFLSLTGGMQGPLTQARDSI
jgi:hypothetical protein